MTIRAAKIPPRSARRFSPLHPAPRKSATGKAAIERALAALGADDLLVIAGKGHETGQIIGRQVIPFNDADVARRAAGCHGGCVVSASVLWTAEEALRATAGDGPEGWRATGVSIDSRTLQRRAIFSWRLQGDSRDGHRFVADAFAKGGRRRARLAQDRSRRAAACHKRHARGVARDSAQAARARIGRQSHCGHGQRRQDEHEGSASSDLVRAGLNARLRRLLQ